MSRPLRADRFEALSTSTAPGVGGEQHALFAPQVQIHAVSQGVHDDIDALPSQREFFEYLQTIMESFAQLPPFAQQLLRPLFLTIILLCAQGCVSTNQPNFEGRVGISSETLTDSEMNDRQRRFKTLLENPTSSSIAALQTGINECQRNRMLEECAFLFEEADEDDFDDLLQTFQRARDTLGIMNFDRYNPEVIEEALLNYEDPERMPERPVVLVFMSRKDHEESIFDIQALNVESGRIQDIMEDGTAKLILVEVYQMSEIRHHLQVLEERHILRPGNVAAVVFGTHADHEDLQLGINRENAHQLSRLNVFLEEDAPIVLAACKTHEGGYESHNIANVLSLVWNRGIVIGNPHRVVGIDFEITKGELEYIILESFRNWFTLGIIDDTTFLDPEEAVPHQVDRLRKEIPEEVPNEYIQRCVRLGILDADTIDVIHGCRHGSGPDGRTSPEDFRRMMNVLPRQSDRWKLIRSHIPIEVAEHYAALGVRSFDDIRRFHQASISPQMISEYIDNARRIGIEPQFANLHYLRALSISGVPLERALSYIAKDVVQVGVIDTLISMNVSPEMAWEWHQLGLLVGPYGSFGVRHSVAQSVPR